CSVSSVPNASASWTSSYSPAASRARRASATVVATSGKMYFSSSSSVALAMTSCFLADDSSAEKTGREREVIRIVLTTRVRVFIQCSVCCSCAHEAEPNQRQRCQSSLKEFTLNNLL